MTRLDWFVIAPSSRIAGLCHSIVRGEPYSTCQLSCSYCYARWYRGPHGEPSPVHGLGRLIRGLAEAQKSLGAGLPVRVATLSDPFQPVEARYRRTLRLLRLALRHEVPVVLNTRLPAPGGEYLRVLGDLASSGLLLVQVTITGLEEDWPVLRRLEPGSPRPSVRLEAVRQASSMGAPVMARLQPLIPGIGDRDPPGFMEAVSDAGARGVIIEFLRIERDLARFIDGIVGSGVGWEAYASEEAGILHPPLAYRLDSALRLWREAETRGLAFQTCKEGLFHLHTPRDLDCCGFGLFGVPTMRRPHLADVYTLALEEGPLPVEEAVDRVCRARGETLLCGDKIELLPSWLRRGYRLHERRLRRIIVARPDLVEKLSPALRVRDGLVEAALMPPTGG